MAVVSHVQAAEREPPADGLERVITPGYGVPGMPGYDPTPHELNCG